VIIQNMLIRIQMKYKFGRKKEGNPSIHQELQLGTYGYAIKEEFGRCDGLFLLCYNKDTSVMKEVPVSIDFINQSYTSRRMSCNGMGV